MMSGVAYYTWLICLFSLPQLGMLEQFRGGCAFTECATVSLNCQNNVIQLINGRYRIFATNFRKLSSDDWSALESRCSLRPHCTVRLQDCGLCHCAEVNYNCVEPPTTTSTPSPTTTTTISTTTTVSAATKTTTTPTPSTTRNTSNTATAETTVTTATSTLYTTGPVATTTVVQPVSTTPENNDSTQSPWTTGTNARTTAVSATTVFMMTTSTAQPATEGQESPQTDENSPSGAVIAGAVVAVTVFLIAIGSVAFVMWRRRRTKKGNNSGTSVQNKTYEPSDSPIQIGLKRTQGADRNREAHDNAALELGETTPQTYAEAAGGTRETTLTAVTSPADGPGDDYNRIQFGSKQFSVEPGYGTLATVTPHSDPTYSHLAPSAAKTFDNAYSTTAVVAKSATTNGREENYENFGHREGNDVTVDQEDTYNHLYDARAHTSRDGNGDEEEDNYSHLSRTVNKREERRPEPHKNKNNANQEHAGSPRVQPSDRPGLAEDSSYYELERSTQCKTDAEPVYELERVEGRTRAGQDSGDQVYEFAQESSESGETCRYPAEDPDLVPDSDDHQYFILEAEPVPK